MSDNPILTKTVHEHFAAAPQPIRDMAFGSPDCCGMCGKPGTIAVDWRMAPLALCEADAEWLARERERAGGSIEIVRNGKVEMIRFTEIEYDGLCRSCRERPRANRLAKLCTECRAHNKEESQRRQKALLKLVVVGT